VTQDDDGFDADQLKSGMWRVTHRDTRIAGVGRSQDEAREQCRENMRLAAAGAYQKGAVPRPVGGPSDATPVDLHRVDPCAETVTNGKVDDDASS
jgi:hypothetical protein